MREIFLSDVPLVTMAAAVKHALIIRYSTKNKIVNDDTVPQKNRDTKFHRLLCEFNQLAYIDELCTGASICAPNQRH